MIDLKIRKSTLHLVITTVALYHLLLVKIQPKYIPQYAMLRIILLFVGGVFVFPYVKYAFNRKNSIVTILFCLFAFFAVFASINSRNMQSSYLSQPILYTGGLLELLILLAVAKEEGRLKTVIQTLYIMTFLYCAITDLLAIRDLNVFYGGDSFLIGNKFTVSYLHIWLYVLYLFKNEIEFSSIQNKFVEGVHIAWALSIAIFTGCTTAVIAIFVLILILKFGVPKFSLLIKPTVMFGALTISGVFFAIAEIVLKWKPIEYVITKVLDKDLHLTGRTLIYQLAPAFVKKNLLFGVGMENNYSASIVSLGQANVQSGVLDLIISFGIIGTSLIFVILFYALVSARKRASVSVTAIAVIYMYIIIATVEIPFYAWFMLVILLLYFVDGSGCVFLSRGDINGNKRK